MPGEANPLRTSDVELKWFTHAKGEKRGEWAPPNSVRTLNVLMVTLCCGFRIERSRCDRKATTSFSAQTSRVRSDQKRGRLC